MGAAVAAIHHGLFAWLQYHDLYGIICFVHPGIHMVVFHAIFVVAQTARVLATQASGLATLGGVSIDESVQENVEHTAQTMQAARQQQQQADELQQAISVFRLA